MSTLVPDVVIDTTNLLSPLPVLRTKKAIDSMQSGQLLAISASSATAKSDIVRLAERLKLELIDISEEDDTIRITIKK